MIAVAQLYQRTNSLSFFFYFNCPVVYPYSNDIPYGDWCDRLQKFRSIGFSDVFGREEISQLGGLHTREGYLGIPIDLEDLVGNMFH